MISITENKAQKLKKIIDNADNIAVITHKNPDGDAIGSALALQLFLKNRKKNVQVIVPGDYPLFLKWLPGTKDVVIFEHEETQARKAVLGADLIFALDFNMTERIEDMDKVYKEANGIKFLIDHHPNPDNIAEHIFSDISVSSTAELLYWFLNQVFQHPELDKDIAVCLFTGIMTDTGCFNFNASLPGTYRAVAELLSFGIDKDEIFDLVYNNFSEHRMRLLGYCLDKKMQVFQSHAAACISITREELKKYHFVRGDEEGMVNYPLSVKGVSLAAIFIEKEDHIKISFRSKGNVPANRIARDHFNGGGHKNAAGGKYYAPLSDTIKKFISILPVYMNINKDGN